MIFFRSPLLNFKRINFVTDIKEFILSNQSLYNALYLASKDLYDELKRYSKGELKDKDTFKLDISLYKYYIRAHTRSTPFGLFSSVGLIKFGKTTKLGPSKSSNLLVRFDMEILIDYYFQLMKDKSIVQELKYFPNTTLYKSNNKLYYYESLNSSGTLKYNLVSINTNHLVEQILLKVEKGISFNEIIIFLISLKVEKKLANNFLQDLIENQVLISELFPIVNGVCFQKHLFGTLNKIKAGRLSKLIEKIENLNKSNESDFDLVLKLEELKQIGIKLGIPIEGKNNAFHVDVFRSFKNSTINENVIRKIKLVNKILKKTNQSSNFDIDIEFTKRFTARFGDVFVPLTKVFEDEIGRNYICKYERKLSKDSNEFKFKHELIKRSIKNNSLSVEILDDDLELFREEEVVEKGFYFMGSLLFHPGKNREILLLDHISNNTILQLTGRFGYLNKKLELFNKNIARLEEVESDKILLEVSHLPGKRVANVVAHPEYRKCEISLINNPSQKNKISLNDLYLGVIDDELKIYSKSKKKFVVPLMSNAYSYQNDLMPIFKFLCNYGVNEFAEGVVNKEWNWGIFELETFLPRIEYKDIIITPARWKINTSDIIPIIEENEFIDLLQTKYNLPIYFKIVNGDNFININLDYFLSKQVFVDFVRKNKVLILEESLIDLYKGYEPNEIILYLHAKTISKKIKKSIRKPDLNINYINEDWIYFKVYCNNDFQNRVLIKLYIDYIKKLKEENKIVCWFFIRYFDEFNHLRIRFKVKNKFFKSQIFVQLQEIISKIDFVWDLRTENYQPEVYRYTLKSLNDSEKLFQICSELVIEYFIDLKKRNLNEEDFSFYFSVLLLKYLNYSTTESKIFTKNMYDTFSIEFRNQISKDEIRKIYDDFHENKYKLVDIIDKESSKYFSNKTIEKLMYKLRLQCAKIRTRNPDIEILMELTSSYIHMFNNRLFYDKQRFYEYKNYVKLNKFFLLKDYIEIDC